MKFLIFIYNIKKIKFLDLSQKILEILIIRKIENHNCSGIHI